MRKLRPARTTAIAFVTLAALWFTAANGCGKDPYRTALAGSDDVANTVASAIKVTTQYYGTGKLNDPEKATIAGYLDTVTGSNMKFRHAVMDMHKAGVTDSAQYVALAQAFVNSVPTDPVAFHYHSAESQAKFGEVLGAVKAALNGIALAIQNAKPATTTKGGQ